MANNTWAALAGEEVPVRVMSLLTRGWISCDMLAEVPEECPFDAPGGPLYGELLGTVRCAAARFRAWDWGCPRRDAHLHVLWRTAGDGSLRWWTVQAGWQRSSLARASRGWERRCQEFADLFALLEALAPEQDRLAPCAALVECGDPRIALPSAGLIPLLRDFALHRRVYEKDLARLRLPGAPQSAEAGAGDTPEIGALCAMIAARELLDALAYHGVGVFHPWRGCPAAPPGTVLWSLSDQGAVEAESTAGARLPLPVPSTLLLRLSSSGGAPEPEVQAALLRHFWGVRVVLAGEVALRLLQAVEQEADRRISDGRRVLAVRPARAGRRPNGRRALAGAAAILTQYVSERAEQRARRERLQEIGVQLRRLPHFFVQTRPDPSAPPFQRTLALREPSPERAGADTALGSDPIGTRTGESAPGTACTPQCDWRWLDRHGDMVAGGLRLVPEAMRDDVLLVDLADFSSPQPPTDPGPRDAAIAALMETLQGIWAESWGVHWWGSYYHPLPVAHPSYPPRAHLPAPAAARERDRHAGQLVDRLDAAVGVPGIGRQEREVPVRAGMRAGQRLIYLDPLLLLIAATTALFALLRFVCFAAAAPAGLALFTEIALLLLYAGLARIEWTSRRQVVLRIRAQRPRRGRAIACATQRGRLRLPPTLRLHLFGFSYLSGFLLLTQYLDQASHQQEGVALAVLAVGLLPWILHLCGLLGALLVGDWRSWVARRGARRTPEPRDDARPF